MDSNYSLNMPLCSLPCEDVDKLLAEADGGCALLYLFLLRFGPRPGGEIAHALRLSQAELDRCASRLRALGLLAPAEKLPPADETPEYTAEYIVRRSAGDPGFKGVLTETERILGHALSSADMKTLFGIYDHLGLPPEVILLLLNSCVEEYREKFGPGRIPTMRTVEKEAYVWANREVLTLEAAEEFLQEKSRRKDAAEQLKRIFGIRDRDFTPTERKYMNEWFDMGFPPEALEIAFDRTVTNLGQLKWNYMNKIVQSWHAKGLHLPEEIETGDRPKAARSAPAPAPAASSGSDLDRVKKIYDRVKNGQG